MKTAPDPPDRQRIDLWLFYARFCKTRERAKAWIKDGRVRLNRQAVGKPSTLVAPGDVLTLIIGRSVTVIEVVACGTHRGPAIDAQKLYRRPTPRNDPPPAV